MKTWLMIFLATATLAAETNKLSDEKLEDKYTQAVMMARVGLYEEAAAACKEILAQKPDEPTVKRLLREIDDAQRRRKEQDPGYELRGRLEKITVSEVNFRQAAPADVIEFLNAETKKITGEKEGINFVWIVLADTKLNPVTLNLRHVPLTDVLGYVTQLAGLRYRVDAHAVVIYKPGPEKPIPPVSEPDAKAK